MFKYLMHSGTRSYIQNSSVEFDSSLLGFGVKVDQESDVNGVFLSLDDRVRLTYRCTKLAAYIGSKVDGSS